jgi:hypothetical protein
VTDGMTGREDIADETEEAQEVEEMEGGKRLGRGFLSGRTTLERASGLFSIVSLVMYNEVSVLKERRGRGR